MRPAAAIVDRALRSSSGRRDGWQASVDELFDILAPGEAAAALARLMDEAPTPLACEGGFAFESDGWSSAALDKTARAGASVAALFGQPPVFLLHPTVSAPLWRPHAERIVDGGGVIFVPRMQPCDPGVLVHELAHLVCISGHPVIDEGIAAWAEARAGGTIHDTGSPIMSLAQACREFGADADLARLDHHQQEAMRSAGARVVEAILDERDGPARMIRLCRSLRSVSPGAELEAFILRHIASDAATRWGTPMEADSRDFGVPEPLVLPADRASGPFCRDAFAFAQEILSDPLFGPDAIQFAKRLAHWETLLATAGGAATDKRDLARHYSLLIDALADESGSPDPWIMLDAWTRTLAERYPEAPDIAVRLTAYLVQKPYRDGNDAALLDALARRWRDDAAIGPAMRTMLAATPDAAELALA